MGTLLSKYNSYRPKLCCTLIIQQLHLQAVHLQNMTTCINIMQFHYEGHICGYVAKYINNFRMDLHEIRCRCMCFFYELSESFPSASAALYILLFCIDYTIEIANDWLTNPSDKETYILTPFHHSCFLPEEPFQASLILLTGLFITTWWRQSSILALSYRLVRLVSDAVEG